MSTENDAAPAAPAEPAEMTPEAPAAVVATEEQAAPAAPAKTELSPAQCAAHLAEMFPALFGTQGPPKPIKLRIQADLQQRAPGLFTRKALSIVLHRHTTSTPYLKALVAAPSRFDLDGEPAGEIAEEHRQAAREEVERRRAIVAARRAAEAQARGPRNPCPPRAQQPGGATGEDLPGAPGALDAPDQAQPPRQERTAREGGPGPGGRPPRAPREFRERREPRPARGAGAPTDRPDRPDRPARPARPGHRGPDRAHGPQRDARPPRQDLRAEGHQARPHPETPHAQAPSPLPDDPARRERALLLRTYEASSLTKANFCVLKRITEAELDAQLALARQERGPARPRP
jgi:sRNA-binding protein